MATRLICLGKLLILTEDKVVTSCVEFDEKRVFEEIDKILENFSDQRPVEIFKLAVEEAINHQYSFGFIKRPFELIDEKGKVSKFSIHDQEIYKKFRDYILDNESFKRVTESKLVRQREYKESKKSDDVCFQYMKENQYKTRRVSAKFS